MPTELMEIAVSPHTIADHLFEQPYVGRIFLFIVGVHLFWNTMVREYIKRVYSKKVVGIWVLFGHEWIGSTL
jgi:hypothetical protein